MSPALLLSLALSGPFEPTIVVDVDELRSEYREVFTAAADRNHPDPDKVVPRLVTVYEKLPAIKGEISHKEYTRMRRGLENHLEKLYGRVARSRAHRERELARDKARNGDPADFAGGGAELARAKELMDLIQATIAPDTWENSGGKGSIRYFSPVHALVIRQSGEVHHQVGSTIRQLRR